MNQPQNPYQSPNPSAPGQTPPGMPPAQPSAIPKVFGILHIIYAALGGLVALIGLGGGALGKAVFTSIEEEAKKNGKDVTAMTDALDSFLSISMIQSLFSLIFAVIVLVAGIKLLKYRESGRKLSNIWAMSRIAVAIPLTLMAVNAQTKFQEEIEKLAPAKQSLDLSGAMGAGGVLGIILISVYPVVSLILLNQPNAKAALK